MAWQLSSMNTNTTPNKTQGNKREGLSIINNVATLITLNYSLIWAIVITKCLCYFISWSVAMFIIQLWWDIFQCNLIRCNCLVVLGRHISSPNMVEKDPVVYSSVRDGIVQQHSMDGLLWGYNTEHKILWS